MAIVHDGTKIPQFDESWGVGDKDWVWMAWDDLLDENASIDSSTWEVPDHWTVSQELTAQTVKDEDTGTEYTGVNGAFVTTQQAGGSVLTNKVVLSGPSGQQEFSRSILIPVRQL